MLVINKVLPGSFHVAVGTLRVWLDYYHEGFGAGRTFTGVRWLNSAVKELVLAGYSLTQALTGLFPFAVSIILFRFISHLHFLHCMVRLTYR